MELTNAAQDLWEDNFGAETPFALGVEEELLLVGDGNELIDKAARLLSEAEPDSGEVDGELFKAMLEARSEVSANAGRRSMICERSGESCSTRAPA